MNTHYYEDFEIDKEFITYGRTITETDILSYVGLVGVVEELFTNIEFIKKETIFKDRPTPGPLLLAFSEALLSQTLIFDRSAVAWLGVDELRVFNPVYVGDTIYVSSKITDRRETSNPQRGIIGSVQTMTNQHGDKVLSYKIKRMVLKRPSDSS